jgi:uncharacterized protein (TIGR03086 family)
VNELENWSAATEAFAARLAGVGTATRSLATPCVDWTVADLVDHVFDIQHRTPCALDDRFGVVEGRSAREWEALCARALAVLSTPGALDRTVTSAFGPMSAREMVSISTADCLGHTWDLSRALGISDSLPIAALEGAYAFMEPLDELLRGPGMLGARRSPRPEASLQERFLCFAGRDLEWPA